MLRAFPTREETLDFINAASLKDNGGNSKYGCSHYTDEISTFSNGKLVFTGWTVADGGIKDYVWSMDGGKTWTVIPGAPGDGAGEAHFNTIKNKIGEYTFSEGSITKSTFAGNQAQGENIAGLGINLSAYAGQTISITFAAIPVNDEDGLCLIAHLEKVVVAGEPAGGGEEPPVETPTETTSETETETETDALPEMTEYVLNTGTKKAHLPTCSYAASMSEANRQIYVGYLDDLLAAGYTACSRCLP